MRKLLPFAGGIFLGFGIGFVILYGFLRENKTPSVSNLSQRLEQTPVPSLDAPAPDFELVNLDGESKTLEDFHGKPIVLNFWATWCAPCRLEMPVFQTSYEKYAGEFSIVAVNNAETTEDVQTYIDELGLTFEILLDPEGEIQRLYQVRGYPTTFLIDSTGVIRAQHVGLLTEEQLDGYLGELSVGE